MDLYGLLALNMGISRQELLGDLKRIDYRANRRYNPESGRWELFDISHFPLPEHFGIKLDITQPA